MMMVQEEFGQYMPHDLHAMRMFYNPNKMPRTGDCMLVPSTEQNCFRQDSHVLPVQPNKRFLPEHAADLLRCRRRVDITRLGFRTHPSTVQRRNERERNRVKHINTTFSTLRQHLPINSKAKKMSKVETLRSAIRYIKHLQQILDVQGTDDLDTSSEASVASPANVVIKTEDTDSSDSSSTTTMPLMSPPLRPTSACSTTTTSTTATLANVDPMSPVISGDLSPTNSIYSSENSAYETHCTQEDELRELVDWLQ